MKYSVVHNGNGPYHLFDDDGNLTCCGILAPGCHTRNDDATLAEDGVLHNSHFGSGNPEQLSDFCKKCIKAAKVDVKKTNTLYDKIYKQ